MRRNKLIIEKFEVLKAMNLLVRVMNDEAAYGVWCYTIPDQATDEDIAEIAADEDETIFRDACQIFRRICEDCIEHGFFLGAFPGPRGLYGAKKDVIAEDEEDDE